MTEHVDEFQELVERVDKVEIAVEEIKAVPVPDLGELLRCFPGGMPGLVSACGYHRESIYQFANATRTIKFPTKRALTIVEAFAKAKRDAFGKPVTIELLHRSWMTAKKNQPQHGHDCDAAGSSEREIEAHDGHAQPHKTQEEN